jgi:hypothetical protein
MISPFYNEAQVPVGEVVLRLVMNMRTIDATEAIVGSTMPGVIGKLLSKDPPMALSGKVLWGLLRQHHPEVTLDEALGLALGEHQEAIGMAMGDLIRRTFHIGEDAKKDENPPKRRGASKPSSRNGSRQKQEA